MHTKSLNSTQNFQILNSMWYKNTHTSTHTYRLILEP